MRRQVYVVEGRRREVGAWKIRTLAYDFAAAKAALADFRGDSACRIAGWKYRIATYVPKEPSR